MKDLELRASSLPFHAELNGEASSFKPALSANKYLMHGSTPDNDGPLIVDSAAHANNASNRTNGAIQKALPTPIGISNGISPTRTKAHFTTDVTPGKFVGSHYIKVKLDKEKYYYVFTEMNVAVRPPPCTPPLFTLHLTQCTVRLAEHDWHLLPHAGD